MKTREGRGGWKLGADGVVDVGLGLGLGLGMRPKGRRRGELWGEKAAGLSGGDGDDSKHVYLGDMGHARARKTLQSIAEDVQVRRDIVLVLL